jgi:hypothetical protein
MDCQQFIAYLGIDCSSDKHEVCIVSAVGEIIHRARWSTVAKAWIR